MAGIDLRGPSSGNAASVPLGGASTPVTELMPIFVYGDSYWQDGASNGGSPVKATAGASAPSRMKQRTGGALSNYSYGGSRMVEIATAAIGNLWQSVNRGYPANQRSLVVVGTGINDIVIDPNTANAAYQAGFKNALMALLANVSASSRLDDVALTYALAWSSSTSNGSFSSGSYHQSTVTGSGTNFSGSVTPTSAGIIDVLGVVTDSATNPAGVMQITVDGSNNSTFTQNGGMKQFTSAIAGGGTPNFGPAVQSITGLSAAAHTIGGYLSSGTGIYIDALLTRSATPPTVVVVKPPRVTSTATAGVGGTYAAAWSTYSATYKALMDQAIAGFSNAVTLDLDTNGWDPATMLGNDGLHPNDRGMAFITTQVIATAETIGWRNGLNAL